MKKNLLFKKKLCFRWACAFLLILMSLQVFAQVSTTGDQNQVVQKKKITGTVIDNAGMQLPGATVMIKGTTIGATTNLNGNYSLTNVSHMFLKLLQSTT